MPSIAWTAALVLAAAQDPNLCTDSTPPPIEAAVARALPPDTARGIWTTVSGCVAISGMTVVQASRAAAFPVSLHLCVIPSRSTRAACARLPAVGQSWPDTFDSLPALEDLDGDGALEARVGVHEIVMGAWEPGDTVVIVSQMFVVNLVPRPRLALALETRRSFEVTDSITITRSWTVRFADENGDGHNDALVDQATCTTRTYREEEERCTAPRRAAVWLWDRASDTWLRRPDR